ncbi:hypothetical protein GJ698_17345 [Pseudoduganella sp. FT26W]|uniref:DUF1640 domain-containing protein n=1 Tax=Duganella aquatilis TaxID=2666082 RepID=A0A844DDV6_9BURK|nr:hypothetical protein [Duganella aquatilis]MRW85844.1 hypothetical protein [Duganella aquatilis]
MSMKFDDEDRPAYDQAMEARIQKIESELATLKIDGAVIKSNYATKADIAELKTLIAEAKSSIIIWVVSAIFLAQVLPSLLKLFLAS